MSIDRDSLMYGGVGALWPYLSSKQLAVKFRRLDTVGTDRVSFRSTNPKLVVMVGEEDAKKTARLVKHGYDVLWFSDNEAFQDPLRVAKQILDYMVEHYDHSGDSFLDFSSLK